MCPQAFSGGISPSLELILVHSHCDESGVSVGLLPTKDLPGHFDSSFKALFWLRRGGRLPKGNTKCPTAENVPILNPGLAAELDQLIAPLLADSDAIGWRIHG